MADKSLDAALDLKTKGNESFKAGEFDAAIGLYVKAIDTCPPHRYAFYALQWVWYGILNIYALE